MPIVEYFHRAPAPEKSGKLPEVAPEKSGKLPEWASFTAAVTGITIFAFATSSFYVEGLALALQERLAIYFSPADYLRVTPLWAIPALGVPALILVLFLLHPASTQTWLGGLLRGWLLPSRTNSAQNAHEPISRRFYIISGVVLLGLSGLLYLVTRFLPEDRLRAALVCAAVSLIVLLTFSAGAFFLPINAGVRVLLVTAAWLMTFALYLGFTYERYDIIGARSSRVLFESEKDRVAAVEGKVIFDLDRYLLLLADNKTDKLVVAIPYETRLWFSGSVVAIPHQKIKSIQTPPLPQEQVSAGD